MASITADAVNNLTDAVTSLLTIFGVKAASTLGGKRINEGVSKPQVVLHITIPFKYSRQESELCRKIQESKNHLAKLDVI